MSLLWRGSLDERLCRFQACYEWAFGQRISPLSEQGGIKGRKGNLAVENLDHRLYVTVDFKKKQIRALVDTGAQLNVISWNMIQELRKEISDTNVKLVGIHGDVENAQGEVLLSFRL